MSSVPPNVYSSTAQELQTFSDQTEEEKLYHEAVQLVLSKPENKDAGPQEKDLLMTHCTFEELMEALKKKREQSQTFRTKHSGMLWGSSKVVVDTIKRFEKAITSMAQAKAEVTMLIWGPIQFLVTVAGEIFDTLDRLNEIGERLENCLDRFKYHTIRDNASGPLRALLMKFYTHIIQFSITASQTYRRSTSKTAVQLFQKSIKVPFDQFLERLNYLSEEIHKTNTAKSLHDIREAQRRSHQQTSGTPLQLDSFPVQHLRILPDLSSNNFAGREDVLHSIGCSLPLTSNGRTSRAALWGIPGVGKTQIALRFAKRSGDQYSHIFFVHATSSATITTAYRQIALRLKLQRPNENQDPSKDSQLIDLVKMWLSEHSTWLFIFDNVVESGLVRQFTPVAEHGHLIFTTRSQVAAEALAERANVYEVPPLPFKEAVELAYKLQNIDIPYAREKQAAEQLARMVGGLPIAIEQTVSLACLRKVSLSAVLPEVEKRRVLLNQSHLLSMHEDGCSTGAILALTLETLKKQSPQAVELFQLLVYFDPASIPKDIITQGSAELEFHFARQETYDRGLVRTAEELKEIRIKAALARLPWYYQDPFKPDFWKTRIPFGKRLPARTLPRIDSEADRRLESHFHDNRPLREVLEKQVRIENAFLDLRHAGLIREPNDKTIWIHDLFAQLTIALLEEKSQAIHQVTAYTVLLMIYFVFPIPDYNKEKELCNKYLPHAISVLQYCRPFYNDLTIGPELAHLTASTFRLKMSSVSTPSDCDAAEKTIFYYRLAFIGYHQAWQRLREHPLVTDTSILYCACTEYTEEDIKGKRHLFHLHYHQNQRFGSSGGVRAFQTILKLGADVYLLAGRYREAVRTTEQAVNGFLVLYGEHHEVTQSSRGALLHVYKRSKMWLEGKVLGLVMARAHMEMYQGGLVSVLGGWIASDIGDCELGLRNPKAAIWWYGLTLLGLASHWGDDNRDQVGILLKLAAVEGSQHAHGKSLRLAQKGLQIYEDTNRVEPHWNRIDIDILVQFEVAVARQQFELGNLEEAKDYCERALHVCEWDSLTLHTNFTNYRCLWDAGLEAIWVWGCIEYSGSTAPAEWETLHLNITRELSKHALDMYGSFEEPCCGRKYGSEGWNPGAGVEAQLQSLLLELGD